MEDIHIQFWMTLGSFITIIFIFIFIIIMASFETICFHKQYCLFLIPILIYSIFQFVINYSNLTDKDNDRH